MKHTRLELYRVACVVLDLFFNGKSIDQSFDAMLGIIDIGVKGWDN